MLESNWSIQKMHPNKVVSLILMGTELSLMSTCSETISIYSILSSDLLMDMKQVERICEID
jgi:hypothetical protein